MLVPGRFKYKGDETALIAGAIRSSIPKSDLSSKNSRIFVSESSGLLTYIFKTTNQTITATTSQMRQITCFRWIFVDYQEQLTISSIDVGSNASI